MADEARTIETIHTQSGVELLVESCAADRQSEIGLRTTTTRRCLLHWGLRRDTRTEWQQPPQSCWPAGTTPCGLNAVETPFASMDGQGSGLVIRLGPHPAYARFSFALFFPDEPHWDNNQERNYEVTVPRACPDSTALMALRAEVDKEGIPFERVFDLEAQGQLAVAVTKVQDGYQVRLVSNIPGVLALHWGVACRSPYEWSTPPTSLQPPGTTLFGGHTAHTPFTFFNGFHRLRLDFPEAGAPLGLQFVLAQTDSGRWLNHHGNSFYVPVRGNETATV